MGWTARQKVASEAVKRSIEPSSLSTTLRAVQQMCKSSISTISSSHEATHHTKDVAPHGSDLEHSPMILREGRRGWYASAASHSRGKRDIQESAVFTTTARCRGADKNCSFACSVSKARTLIGETDFWSRRRGRVLALLDQAGRIPRVALSPGRAFRGRRATEKRKPRRMVSTRANNSPRQVSEQGYRDRCRETINRRTYAIH